MSKKQGELYYADLSPVVGNEFGGVRPVLVLRGFDNGVAIIAPIRLTNDGINTDYHAVINLKLCTNGTLSYGFVMFDQVRAVDESRIKEKIGEVRDDIVRRAARFMFSDMFGN